MLPEEVGEVSLEMWLTGVKDSGLCHQYFFLKFKAGPNPETLPLTFAHASILTLKEQSS